MKIYKHVTTSEKIEFVGLVGDNEASFRYLGEEFKDITFNITLVDVRKYWKRIFLTNKSQSVS